MGVDKHSNNLAKIAPKPAKIYILSPFLTIGLIHNPNNLAFNLLKQQKNQQYPHPTYRKVHIILCSMPLEPKVQRNVQRNSGWYFCTFFLYRKRNFLCEWGNKMWKLTYLGTQQNLRLKIGRYLLQPQTLFHSPNNNVG